MVIIHERDVDSKKCIKDKTNRNRHDGDEAAKLHQEGLQDFNNELRAWNDWTLYGECWAVIVDYTDMDCNDTILTVNVLVTVLSTLTASLKLGETSKAFDVAPLLSIVNLEAYESKNVPQKNSISICEALNASHE